MPTANHASGDAATSTRTVRHGRSGCSGTACDPVVADGRGQCDKTRVTSTDEGCEGGWRMCDLLGRADEGEPPRV